MRIEEQEYLSFRKGPKPSGRSVAGLFSFGFSMMVLPVLLVSIWPSGSICNTTFLQDICVGTVFYRASLGFLPYVMVIGGVLVGYNMKRIADWDTIVPAH